MADRGSEETFASERTRALGGARPHGRRRLPVQLVVALVGVGLLLALLAYGLLARAPATGIDDQLARGKPAKPPSFSLPLLQRGILGPALGATLGPALSDGRLSLAELRGTPVVLNVWASWCPP